MPTHVNDAAPIAASMPWREPVEMVGSDAAHDLGPDPRSAAGHGAARALADLRDVIHATAFSLSVGANRA